MERYSLIDELTNNWNEEGKLNFFILKWKANATINADNLVTEVLENSGLKKEDLAERVQVSKGYISLVTGGMENLRISTLATILGVLVRELKLELV